MPQDYPTIQAGIDAASPGDRVLIAKGVYSGAGNVDLDTNGKAITILGAGYLSTAIDCGGQFRGFTIHNGETSSTVIEGLTIKRGHQPLGGAMYIVGSSPAINRVSFQDCTADNGGAVALSGGSAGFLSCQFERNRANVGGGAIYSVQASPTLTGCTFEGSDTKGQGGAVYLQSGSAFVISSIFNENIADHGGGGIYAESGNVAVVNGTFSANRADSNGGAIDLNQGEVASLTNCTVAANLSKDNGGAIRTDNTSNATISNSILWSNGQVEYNGQVNIRFSDVAGGTPTGDGNISSDPKLVNAFDHDLHLIVGSPCIDTADATSLVTDQDQDGRKRTIGSAPDMGAYEFPIVRPIPLVAASTNNVFTVPHDGNPNTDTAQVTLHSDAYDWLNGALSYQWSLGDNVVGTTKDLTLTLEPGEQEFDLIVRDPTGDFASQKVKVKVLPEPNSAPVASAGADQTVTTTDGPAHVVIHGNAYDADGDPCTFLWSTGATTQDLTVDLNPGNYTYTLTVTDPYGAQGIARVNIHVIDGIGPIITLNGISPMVLEVFSDWIDPGATARDETDGSDLAVSTYGTVDTQHLGVYTVTYSARDNSGNVGSINREVDVKDTIPPVITLNGANPMSVNCAQGYTEPGATANDNYDGPVPVTISGSVTTTPGTYTVTYTAVDSSGNKATATRTVSVVDQDGPVITLNGSNPMTIECGNGYTEPGATAKDGCVGTSLPVTITGSVLTSKGTYTVTYTATDASGMSATATRTVNVVDTTAPIITLNGSNPMTVECGSGYSEPGATAVDGCDGSNIAVVITGNVPTTKGSYTVTYTATDKSGNIATATRTVNVVDSKGPVIVLNGSNPMSVECGSGYVEPGAVATDVCDGNNITVKITGTVLTKKGTYTVTYTASDSSGNTTTVTRTVNVVDTTPPVITINGANPASVECATGYTDAGATAMDVCDGIVSVQTSNPVSTNRGTYTVTYTATDSSGNKATATRTVNVVDTTPPVITLTGSNPMTVECGSGYSEPGASAYDSCDGTVTVSISGTVLTSKGTYTRTYTAIDKSGNVATVTRTINVTDTTPPVITLKGSNPMTVACGSGYSEPGATATDTCDGSVSVVITGSVLTSKGTYTVTYKATDSSGNSATATRTVNVTDTTPPTITLNGSNPMTVECGSGYTEPGATANDTCDGSITVKISGTVVTSAKGTYTVTYTATDSAGNTATATRTVNVVDTTAPVITLNGSNPMTVDCTKGYTEPGATALDACDGSVTVTITGSVPSTAGTYTVTYTATDKSGNTSTVTRTVYVVAKVPPSANNFNATPTGIKADNKMHAINLHYGFDQHCAAYSWDVECTANQTVSNGDIVKIDNNNFNVKGVTGRIYTFTLTVTDIDGNTASYQITVACT